MTVLCEYYAPHTISSVLTAVAQVSQSHVCLNTHHLQATARMEEGSWRPRDVATLSNSKLDFALEYREVVDWFSGVLESSAR